MRGTEFRETAHRLYPLPVEEVPEGGVYSDLRLPNFVLPQDRPYIMINVVSSLDGKAAIEGRAGDIGGEADRRAMRNLRAIADAVMIGGGTLRAEKLSLGLPEDLQKLRASQGRGRQPLAVILTSTGSIPIRSNLLHNTIDNTLVLLPENAPQIPDQATIERLPHRQEGVDLKEAMKLLKSKYGTNLLLVEGGPKVNHALLKQELADQLFLTISPKTLGGDGLTTVEGQLLPERARGPHTLASVYLTESAIFLRYLLHRRPELER